MSVVVRSSAIGLASLAKQDFWWESAARSAAGRRATSVRAAGIVRKKLVSNSSWLLKLRRIRQM